MPRAALAEELHWGSDGRKDKGSAIAAIASALGNREVCGHGWGGHKRGTRELASSMLEQYWNLSTPCRSQVSMAYSLLFGRR